MPNTVPWTRGFKLRPFIKPAGAFRKNIPGQAAERSVPARHERVQHGGSYLDAVRTASRTFSKVSSKFGMAANGTMFGPSLKARFGLGCVSMNIPSAPAATAGRDRNGVYSRRQRARDHAAP